MAKKAYFIENINEEKWRFLINWVRKKAFYFVVVKEPDRIKTGFFKTERVYPKDLELLKDLLVEEYDSKERWHRKQFFSSHFYKFRIDKKVWKLLENETLLNLYLNKGIEDPSFFDINDNPILETISHEDYAFVFLENKEVQMFIKKGFEIVEHKWGVD